jgi:hypothetical protein
MRRRFGADVLLAIVLPVVCVLVLLLLHPDRSQPHGSEPVTTPLTSASVVCPDALPGSGTDLLGVSTLGTDPSAAVTGEVQVGLGASASPLEVRTLRVSAAPAGTGASVVTGSGDLAPGLVAGRSQTAPLAAVDCAPPVADQWFTAAGADATHDSVVELVNPNAGPAVADIIVRSAGGVLDVPALRGIAVPGSSTVRLDLGQVTPNRSELSLEVHTGRGRLAVHVVDSRDELGSGTRSQDWLPSQAGPSTTNVLLGLTTGVGERTLVLANPGGDEVRASVKVITPASTFAPTGVDAIRVAPDSTESVSLDDVLAQAAQDGAVGVLVEADGPVTASLRQVVDGDLSLLAPAPAVDATSAVVVPTGAKRLLLSGAAGADTGVTVSSYSANGKQLDQSEVTIVGGGVADVAVPDKAVLVTVVPQGPVRGALLLTGTGTAVVPLRPLVLSGLVPDVRPGVP